MEVDMNQENKSALLKKNQQLIDMVIERVKRDFVEDIAIVGLTGSFSTGDFHEKSDLDLIIINNTDRGWEISSCFILGDVGYDIYCTPWETRIKDQSLLASDHAGCLLDMEILYCGKEAYMERLEAYRENARKLLAEPIGRGNLERAAKVLDRAKVSYAEMMTADHIGKKKLTTSQMVLQLINGLVQMNNTYIKGGTIRYVSELKKLKYVPDKFNDLYEKLIMADDEITIEASALKLLKCVVAYYKQLWDQFVETESPSYDNLEGSYEELWCNCKNKVLRTTQVNDLSYTYHVARDAQLFFDEMREMFGTVEVDLMTDFRADNPEALNQSFLEAMALYKKEYDQVGREILKFNDFESLYKHFMA